MNISVTAPQVGIGISSVVGIIALVFSIVKYDDSKRKNIYKRIDEEREKNKTQYVAKELCEERAKHIQETVKEIRDDVKTLLRANGVK